MNKTHLLCALTLLTALAAGCGSAEMQTITNDASDTEVSDAVLPTKDAGETITPTEEADSGTPTPPTTDPNGGNGGSGGTGGGGTGGTGGGTRPDLSDVIGDHPDLISDPQPTPPDNGGSGGGGGLHDPDGIGCHFQGPTSGGGRRMKNNNTLPDAGADVLDMNDCFIL